MKALIFASLFCATAVGAEGPVAYIWQVTCAAVDSRLTAGPYSTPDQCQEARAQTVAACERPLLGPNQPNPDFVRVADVCKEAHNGRDCVCEYLAVHAEPVPAAAPRCTLGALMRANVTTCADLRKTWAAGGPIKIGP